MLLSAHAACAELSRTRPPLLRPSLRYGHICWLPGTPASPIPPLFSHPHISSLFSYLSSACLYSTLSSWKIKQNGESKKRSEDPKGLGNRSKCGARPWRWEPLLSSTWPAYDAAFIKSQDRRGKEMAQLVNACCTNITH